MADPLNLAGVILPGPRIPSVPANFLVIKDGCLVRTVMGKQGDDRRIDAPASIREVSDR